MIDHETRKQKAQARFDQMDAQVNTLQAQYAEAISTHGENSLIATRLKGQLNGMTERYWRFYKTHIEPENPFETEERERREQLAQTPTEQVKAEDVKVGDVLLTHSQDELTARLGCENYNLSTVTRIEHDSENRYFQIKEAHFSGIYCRSGEQMDRVVTK